MARLRLTLACWDYDRTRALIDGRVRPEGIDLNYLSQPVEEIFFRMAKFREFDAAEMSLSSFACSLFLKTKPFVAIPVFPSRFFRHSCIFAGPKIRRPADLKGKRVGVPEYQMTAPVWIRGILSDDYGVKVTDMQHFSGGQDEPGRVDKLGVELPKAISLQGIGKNKTLTKMLADGELDALFTARTPPQAKRLFDDAVAVEKEYYRRTKIFPIMHTVVIRREVYEKNRWVAQSLFKAFEKAKRLAYESYRQTAALASMLPWSVAHADEARREMGEDWWPYGLEPNRHVLETFLRYHHEQGLSKKRLRPEDLFAKETLEHFKI